MAKAETEEWDVGKKAEGMMLLCAGLRDCFVSFSPSFLRSSSPLRVRRKEPRMLAEKTQHRSDGDVLGKE